MLRILTLAAAAALTIAAPASAKSVRISTAGKSNDQVQAEVAKAARSLCARATIGATFPIELQRTCVKQTVSHTMEQMAATTGATQVADR